MKIQRDAFSQLFSIISTFKLLNLISILLIEMKKHILILILGGVSILGCQNSNNEQTSSNSNSSSELQKDTTSISTENSTTNFQIKITPEQEV
ncbi:MAG: hypothetical protein RLZZ155_232, partial [Bacteroidota bacterium]